MPVIFLREKLRGLLRPRRHQITVLRTGSRSNSAVLRRVRVREGAMLLDALLKRGVDYPHLCKLGDCRRCRSRLVTSSNHTGPPDHSGDTSTISGRASVRRASHYDGALSDAEIEAGYFLACRATPLADCTIQAAPPEPRVQE